MGDGGEQVLQAVPGAVGARHERRGPVNPVLRLAAEAEQAGLRVTGMAYGQEVAVLGVQQEEEAVEQAQRRFTRRLAPGSGLRGHCGQWRRPARETLG